MRTILKTLAVAVMLLLGQLTFAASADDESMADAMAVDDLSTEELRVNINTDDAATIAAGLRGIGIKRAEAIVRYREANGPFRSADELVDVKGIGARTVAANLNRIEVR